LERRQFIKQLIGTGSQNILKWTVLIALLFVFYKVDFTKLSYDLLSILKFAGTLLLLLTSFFSVLFLIALLFRKLTYLLPVKVVHWFKKYHQGLDLVAYLLLFAIVVFYAITRNNYFILILLICSSLFSFLNKRYFREGELNTSKEFTK
jgi:hypothetical protein